MAITLPANLPKFVKTTQANFPASPDPSTLYFITDLQQLWLGNKPFTMTPIVVETGDLPETTEAVPNALYIKVSDGTAHVFDGTAYHALSVAKETTLGSLSSDTGTVPTAYAAQQYANSAAAQASSNKLDKLTSAASHTDKIAFFGDGGTAVADKGISLGGATLAETPVSTTVATEKAVDAAIATASSALNTSITTTSSTLNTSITTTSSTLNASITAASSALNTAKIDKFNGTENHIVYVDATSTKASVKDSGIVVGGAALAATPVSTTVATEKAVKDYADSIGTAANSYTDNAISALGAVFNFKGTKADMEALNDVTEPNTGDVWHVMSGANGSSAEYVYDGSAWEELGTILDLSGYAEKAVPTAAGEIATLDANGGLVASGKQIGGATLAATPDSVTVATEAAVKAYADGVASAAAGAYIPFISDATASNVPLIGAGGETLTDSGVVIGSAALAETPVSTTLATEKAVADAISTASSALNTTITTTSSALNSSISAASSALNTAKLDKLTSAASHTDKVAFFAAGGTEVADKGISLGSATLAATPVSTTLATEAAVSAAISTSASSKLDKLTSAASHTDKVAFFSNGGTAVADKGYAVDSTAFTSNDSPSSVTLTTEKAVASYVDAVLSAMCWSTLHNA